MSDTPTNMEEAIHAVCAELAQLLIRKNASYGNSVGEPVRVFSKLPPNERMGVRLDDKLSRLMRGHEYPDEDTELDIVGYLMLKRAIKLCKKTTPSKTCSCIGTKDGSHSCQC